MAHAAFVQASQRSESWPCFSRWQAAFCSRQGRQRSLQQVGAAQPQLGSAPHAGAACCTGRGGRSCTGRSSRSCTGRAAGAAQSGRAHAGSHLLQQLGLQASLCTACSISRGKARSMLRAGAAQLVPHRTPDGTHPFSKLTVMTRSNRSAHGVALAKVAMPRPRRPRESNDTHFDTLLHGKRDTLHTIRRQIAVPFRHRVTAVSMLSSAPSGFHVKSIRMYDPDFSRSGISPNCRLLFRATGG